MLFIVIEVILAIGLFIWAGLDIYYHYGNKKTIKIFEGFTPFDNEGPTIAFMCVIIILILTLFAGVGFYIDGYTSRISCDEQCAAIEYQIENGAFGDDAGLYNLNKEIREWNADVKWYREYRDNPWFGLFIPNFLGDYPTFDLVKGN